MATYEKDIYIDSELADQIDHYLNDDITSRDECLDEDETITKTVNFGNGIEMDIKCCGVQFHEDTDYYGPNNAWCEAVLFDNGNEVACTEVEEEFLGPWELDYNGDTYIANVEVE